MAQVMSSWNVIFQGAAFAYNGPDSWSQPAQHGPSLRAPVDSKHSEKLEETKPAELMPDGSHRHLRILFQDLQNYLRFHICISWRTQEISRIHRNIEFKCENPTNKDIDIIYKFINE